MTTINLKCHCGEVKGSAINITPRSGNRVVCCCRDCQAFINFLDSEVRVLDTHGGTEIYQTTQSQVKIHRGQEYLRVIRLSPKGLFRWYTACCKTPVGNSMKADVPFFGIIHSFADIDNVDETCGEVRAYCQTTDAIGEVTHLKAHPKFPPHLIARILRQFFVWKLKGKHKPSAFFNANGKPIAEPLIMEGKV